MGGTAPAHDAQRIVDALRKVVLGQEAATLEVLVCLLARGHILLEGVPGTAKTLMVRTLALALDVRFVRIQFTPDLMPADITGITLLTGAQQFSFRPGPVFADLVLADEINRAPAKTRTQSSSRAPIPSPKQSSIASWRRCKSATRRLKWSRAS